MPKKTQITEAPHSLPPSTKQAFHTSSPERCAFSVSPAGLVPTPTNKCWPRINPLGCHPDVMGMAEQLADTSEVLTPPMDTLIPRIETTKEEVEELENARRSILPS
jgi:hypothetical protein